MRYLISATALALALTACGGGDDEAERASTTDAAGEKCDPGVESAKAISYRYDAKSIAMSVDTASIDGQLDGITTISCIISDLDGPSSLADRVGATRAIDGSQSEEWGAFEANWSFSAADDRLLFTVDAK